MKNKNNLSKIPKKSQNISWEMENEKIVITVENKGIFNFVMQFLLKKPKKSKIHLDEMGSFIWREIDGEKSVYDISKRLSEKFGKSAQPLYARLEKFFNSLYECKFIVW